METCSVIVLSYNSGSTVVETLESIKAQSYTNIQLIINDDYSKDNSVEIISKWLDCNSIYFDDVIVNFSKDNLGIPRSLNDCIKKSTGKYIKVIAADDILLPDCLSKSYMHLEKSGSLICFSYAKIFSNALDDTDIIIPDTHARRLFNYSAKKQFNNLLKECFPPAPSVFYDRELFNQYGLFDERFLSEDHPYWIHLTNKNVKLSFLDEITVYYRKSSNSITGNSGLSKFNFEVKRLIYNLLICKFKPAHSFTRLSYLYELWLMKNIIYSNSKLISRLCLFFRSFTPYFIYRKMKKLYEDIDFN